MRAMYLLYSILLILIPLPVAAKQISSPLFQTNPSPTASIDAPVAGQVIQGGLAIRGSTGSEGFQSYEVDFSYQDDPTNTWFLIQESTMPVQEGVLAVWDTTTITDGDYKLRLLVILSNGSQEEGLVNDLRVRNYTAIETDTPTPSPIYVTLAPGLIVASATPGNQLTATATTAVTPTPLPTNPAIITGAQIGITFGIGAGASIALLALLGAYLGMRAILRNNR